MIKIDSLLIKIRKSIISIPEIIGSLFLVAVAFGSVFILLRTIYRSLWIPIILLMGCPFMAYSARKGLVWVAYAICLLTVFCDVCIVSSRNKHVTLIQSIFLKGERKHHEIFIPESEDDEDNISPEHYATQYYFEVDPKSKNMSLIIEWGTMIIVVLMPAMVYFILRKKIN